MTNTTTATATHPLIALAELVARNGIEAHHDAIVAAVRDTDLARAFPVLADLAVDGTAPPVARERAIGRLASVATTKVRAPRSGVTTVWQAHAA